MGRLMHRSRDGSSVYSGPVPDAIGAPNPYVFVRDLTAYYEWTDTGALVIRQSRDEIHLSPIQVAALLRFIADAGEVR